MESASDHLLAREAAVRIEIAGRFYGDPRTSTVESSTRGLPFEEALKGGPFAITVYRNEVVVEVGKDRALCALPAPERLPGRERRGVTAGRLSSSVAEASRGTADNAATPGG